MIQRRNRLMAFFILVMAVTIAFGFAAWWTLPLVAFTSGYYLVLSLGFRSGVLIASLAPATGWLVTAVMRDIAEGMRVSNKLASLLNVGFGLVVYIIIFLIALLVSFFAAWSGGETSKALG